MSVVNIETGELIEVTEQEVRASIRRVIDHAESIWDEWAWQVENHTWAVLGYGSWDEMRRAEYGALTSVSAPRAERPELVARFRGAGLTQQQTATTLGVSQQTVSNYDEPRQIHPAKGSTNSGTSDEDIVEAELVEDAEPAYYRGPDPGPEPTRAGQTPWSRRVQDISAQCPMTTLTDDEVTELLGAATFLRDYCRGELTTRRSNK